MPHSVLKLIKPVYIWDAATVVGHEEFQGPLGQFFDLHDPKIASGRSLFAERLPEKVEEYSLQNRVTDKTVPTFFFHTSDDSGVSVKHSLVYASALRDHGVPFEMHIYPHGKHGLGLALDKYAYACDFFTLRYDYLAF